MNTPAYFCFDNFGATGTEVLPEKNVEVSTGIASSLGETEEGVTIFNLAGQRIQKIQRGINIINGKKVLR